MRKNLKKQAVIMPLPVVIIATYNEDGTANAMNAAWGTVADTDQVAICVSAHHKTMKNILDRKAFTVTFGDVNHVKEADYFGIVSGNKVGDKVAKAGLTVTKSEYVDAPIINELPITMECEFLSYDTETEFLFGTVKNLSADESVLDAEGNVDMTKFRPLAFDTFNKAYVVLGEVVGKAFSDGNALK